MRNADTKTVFLREVINSAAFRYGWNSCMEGRPFDPDAWRHHGNAMWN